MYQTVIGKKVIFLVPGFPENETDTTCIPALQDYVLYFARLNPEIDIEVISFQYPFFKGNYKWNGINVYTAGGRNKRGFWRLLTWLRVSMYFLGLIYRSSREHSKIKVIHSFWLSECTLVGQYLARLFKIKHIATIFGQDAKPSNVYLKRLDLDKVTITCASHIISDLFKDSTGRNVDKYIPIGLDVDKFKQKTRNKPRKIDILGVGSLIPLKNYRLFIEIISELKNEFPGLNAVIIGDGPEYDLLSKMILESKVSENIKLTGELPRDQVIDHMLESRILLHPSSYEGQGYVFLEALYCGLTIVCFKVGYLESSEKAVICDDKKEMIKNIGRLLREDFIDSPLLLKSMEETVNDFKMIY